MTRIRDALDPEELRADTNLVVRLRNGRIALSVIADGSGCISIDRGIPVC